MNTQKKELPAERKEELLEILRKRFEKNTSRHKKLQWEPIQKKLEARRDKLWSLDEMEQSGGEPDVVGYDEQTDEYLFFDCSPETPKGRRSICYDHEALEKRKMHKPHNSAINMASEMGVDILDEEQYKMLQELGHFDSKTSSWLKTPPAVRKLGGAIFGDYRFGRVFVYHNGADSYYGVRGFRSVLRV